MRVKEIPKLWGGIQLLNPTSLGCKPSKHPIPEVPVWDGRVLSSQEECVVCVCGGCGSKVGRKWKGSLVCLANPLPNLRCYRGSGKGSRQRKRWEREVWSVWWVITFPGRSHKSPEHCFFLPEPSQLPVANIPNIYKTS